MNLSSQVPRAELETWLVQREPDPLPIRCPDRTSLRERAPPEAERELTVQPVEPRAGLQDEEEEDTEVHQFHSHCLLKCVETCIYLPRFCPVCEPGCVTVQS